MWRLLCQAGRLRSRGRREEWKGCHRSSWPPGMECHTLRPKAAEVPLTPIPAQFSPWWGGVLSLEHPSFPCTWAEPSSLGFPPCPRLWGCVLLPPVMRRTQSNNQGLKRTQGARRKEEKGLQGSLEYLPDPSSNLARGHRFNPGWGRRRRDPASALQGAVLTPTHCPQWGTVAVRVWPDLSAEPLLWVGRIYTCPCAPSSGPHVIPFFPPPGFKGVSRAR